MSAARAFFSGMRPDMKRNFLVVTFMAMAVVAFTTADASAWGWWRYRLACHGPLFPRWAAHRACHPYNAFTPSPGCCGGIAGHAGFGQRLGHLHGAAGCSTCMASPVMPSGDQRAQYIDPSLLPYMAQAAPMQMQMPIQQTAYQAPYGLQPVNYMANYYQAYQPYPYYYYPQPVAPYNYGYGYGYGYGY